MCNSEHPVLRHTLIWMLLTSFVFINEWLKIRLFRFGVLKGGAKDVKSHDWFKGVDFDQIFQRKIKPTFIPNVSGDGDTKFFEKYNDIVLRETSTEEYMEDFRDLKIKTNWFFKYVLYYTESNIQSFEHIVEFIYLAYGLTFSMTIYHVHKLSKQTYHNWMTKRHTHIYIKMKKQRKINYIFKIEFSYSCKIWGCSRNPHLMPSVYTLPLCNWMFDVENRNRRTHSFCFVVID